MTKRACYATIMDPARRVGDPPGLEPPPAPPTAVTSLAVWVAAAQAGLVVVGIIALFAAGLGHRAWEAMQEGGWPMLVLLPATLVVLAVQGWYGWMTTRRPHLPSWLVLLGPATLLLLGLGGLVLQLHEIQAALTATPTTWHPTLVNAGMSEALNVGVLGAAGAALSAHGAAISLAVCALARSEAPAFDRGARVALGFAATTLAAVTVVALSWPLLHGWPLLMLLPAATGTACVAMGGLARGSASDGSQAAILTDMVGSALAIAASALSIAMAGRSAAVAEGYGALSAKCSDSCLMVEIFAAGWTTTSRLLLPSAIFALPAIVGVAALWSMKPRPRLSAVADAWGAPVAGLALLLFSTLPEVHLQQLARGHAATLRDAPLPDDLTLVVESAPNVAIYPFERRLDIGRLDVRWGTERLAATADLDHAAGCESIAAATEKRIPRGEVVPVAIDASVPFGRWACLLRAQQARRLATATRSRHAGTHELVTEVRPESHVILSPPYDALFPMMRTIVIVAHDVDAEVTASGLPVVDVTLTASTIALTRAGVSARASGSDAERRTWLAGNLAEEESLVMRASADVPTSAVLGCLALSARRLAFVHLEPFDQREVAPTAPRP